MHVLCLLFGRWLTFRLKHTQSPLQSYVISQQCKQFDRLLNVACPGIKAAFDSVFCRHLTEALYRNTGVRVGVGL